jgi:cell division protein FtsX
MTGGRAADLARRIARPFERNRALAAVASAVAVIAVAAVTAFAVQVAVPSHAPAAPQRYHAVVTLPAQPDS